MKSYFFIERILILFFFSIIGITICNGKEKDIVGLSIYDKMLEKPQPQGIVDENSPWLHFRIPFSSNGEYEKQFTKRRYFFKLSQDSTFAKNVICSKPKMWSFYNPYRILEKGKWYWTYGVSTDGNINEVKWADETLSFVITGKERKVVYPTPEELLAKIKNTHGPHVVMLRKDIGNLLPDNHKGIKKRLLADFERIYNDKREYKIVVDTSVYPKHLTPSGIRRHFTLKTLKMFTSLSDQARTLLFAYLLTGEEKYKSKGLSAFYSLDDEYHTTMMQYSKRKGFPDDFAVEQHTKTMNLVLDAFADDLSDERRERTVELLYKIKKEGYLNFYKQLEFSEHTVYKAHLWQMCVYTLLSSSIILSPYKEEAALWAEYAYELWLYRNPAGSRNDGGWHADNGYFGVNERQLTFTPLFLSRLMSYNYFDHPWYQNVSKYLSYSAPYGNPGVAFGDAVGYNGCAQANLSEVLSYLYPDNYWNLWRMRTFEKNGTVKRKFNLGQESVWSLLFAWKEYDKPKYDSINSPEELAALFPDIGYVGMHTDLENPDKNLLLNFRSCPYGQINHAHPAQNAFNVAYGDEPLFWRTGHYATTQAHSGLCFKHSRAHNTILADGIGQACDVSGYGWISRFLTGKKISYAVGDASNAYSGVDERFSEKFKKRGEFEVSRKTGFGNPGVTLFKRHIAMLRPRFVVVYDELESKTPINWTFMLHSIKNLEKISDSHISTFNKNAVADAYIYSSEKMTASVTDKFMADPIDVQGKLKNGKDRYPNHWHCSVSTDNKANKVRILTIIEVTPNGENKIFIPESKITKEGYMMLDAGEYKIKAEMRPEHMPYLEIKDRGTFTFFSNDSKLNGVSVLYESNDNGETNKVISDDMIPDAVKYGNQY